MQPPPPTALIDIRSVKRSFHSVECQQGSRGWFIFPPGPLPAGANAAVMVTFPGSNRAFPPMQWMAGSYIHQARALAFQGNPVHLCPE